MLRTLGWQLADATPRRLALNPAFMDALRNKVSWILAQDPVLSDLHPSLGNSDHIGRIIHDLRRELYPDGMSLEGSKFLSC
jgi:hypothetical protein